ncbi:MAG: NAD(P)/FAD-dependent oxidoreductase [Luteitalea sp.]|nr:NAD(P)/FAD-dependent oxidoreductase [Luteitalea sp.]
MTPRSRLVVVGNGMAGARLVEDVVAKGGNQIFDISVFGDEPHGNYNRILLSGVLAGTHRMEDIVINPLSWYQANRIRLHAGNRVERLDLASREVIGSDGVVEPYDTLVIATGSRPLLPSIAGLVSDDGTLKDGAFVFRTIDDCDRMLMRARDARAAVVIGGGLLGIEAARGLRNHGLDVHILHLTPHVMDAQLDPPASRILQRQLEQTGLKVLTDRSTTALLGEGCVDGVMFSDGSTLPCDMVVVAAGIRPNVQLARAAGLPVQRGILVGDDLACQGVPGVYAIGECAEHRGQLYGLVAPLWEQAQILSDRLTRRRADAIYAGSRLTTKLKVAGLDVAVMGLKDAVEDEDEVVSYAEPSRGIYKKLILRNDRLVGAILIGDGPLVPGVAQAFADEGVLAERRSELLFPLPIDSPRRTPEQMTDDTQICDCNVVSKAQIVEAVLGGATSLLAVCERTRAGTGCGSCRPEVQRIVEMTCASVDAREALTPSPAPAPAGAADQDDKVVVTLNKVERIKKEKDGLDIVPEIPSLAQGGWEAITEADRERLKWAGVFFRRQTPGRFMIRLRIPNGFTNADQVRSIADVAEEFGTPLVDITTRQQIQIRGFAIEHVPEIGRRLEAVGLLSLQTGMDNIRNVVGCAAAGLTTGELFDASPVVHEFTDMFVGNKAFTNLPRKFNVGISGCTEHCTHAESQDLALTPAVKTAANGQPRHGFNIAVGGKMGSGGCRVASPLDVFVDPAEAAAVCREIVFLFRDHGSRAARNRARLSFLLEKWGADRFRRELAERLGRMLEPAGRDARIQRGTDHIGIHRQRQAGLNYAGLLAAVGRVPAGTLRDVARVAAEYGTGDIRFTTTQNIIIPNVPDAVLSRFRAEPLLAGLPHDPPGALRGLVACTGIDYCHFALIETKDIAVKTAEILALRLPHDQRVTTHWSGCPAGCGNHAAADIGLLGKNVRVNGEMIEAVDIFIGGRAGPHAKAGIKMLEDVPCADLPAVLETLIPYVTGRRAAAAAPPPAPPSPSEYANV